MEPGQDTLESTISAEADCTQWDGSETKEEARVRIHKKFRQRMVWDVNTENGGILGEAEGILETFTVEDIAGHLINSPVLHMTVDTVSQEGGVT